MAKKRRKRKAPLSPSDLKQRRAQRSFRAKIRFIFESAGFDLVPTKDKEITFLNRVGEFDWIFVHENIIVIAEDTVSGTSSATRDHLLKKQQFYDHLRANQSEFLKFLRKEFPESSCLNNDAYGPHDIRFVFVYCSKTRMEDQHKEPHLKTTRFLEDRHVQYFSALAKTIGKTMRFELFKFLNIQSQDIGHTAGRENKSFAGFILPESPSDFPSGFKVVTFYIDPKTLMHVSYVLRKDSWDDSSSLYQRMISRGKIKNMRRYLAEADRVFINNIIVSLPFGTKVLDAGTKTQIDIASLTKTTPVEVEVPIRFNSVGLIDGQHRVFAYHEGTDSFEKSIAIKRSRQQLLVTGVVYPKSISVDDQHEFEARLFLEINDKQTRTKADLRQAIEAIVNPFSVIAVSKAIIVKLAANGPLTGILEEHQFETGKLKSSSIVSYGLRHIVKPEGPESFFSIWNHAEKNLLGEAIRNATDGKREFDRPQKATLDNYIQFCASQINALLIGFKMSLSTDMWSLDRKVSRALSTTSINGLIFCLRVLLEQGKTTTLDGYKAAFKKLTVDYSPKKFKYKSSHWRSLGERIAKECF